MKLIIILLLLAGLLARVSADKRAHAIIGKVQKRYKTVKAFQADFVQTNLWPELGRQRKTSGKIYVAEPNKFLLKYAKPKGQFLLCDGTYVYLYSPKTSQVIKFATSRLEHGLKFKDLIYKYPKESKTRFIGVENVGGAYCNKLLLLPRTKKVDFVFMEIWIGTRDNLIHQVAYADDSGNKITYTFSKTIVNPTLGPMIFHFNKPSGAEVIDKTQ